MIRFLFVAAALLSSVAMAASDIQQIDALIKSAQKINVANLSTNQEDGDLIVPTHSVGFSGSGNNRMELFERRMHLAKALEQFVAFDPNASALFPGSLVQGKSLPDGVLFPITALRNPLDITITGLVSTDPTVSFSKEKVDPTLAKTTDAIHQILTQNLSADQPAKISYNLTSVSSLQEAFLKLGAKFEWVTGNVSGSFQDNSSNYATSVLVKFVQSYYTVTCKAPLSPTDYISKRERFGDFKNYAGAMNPPAYVSSVTYGRELWMLIETNHQTSDVTAALSAAFSGGFASGSADLSTGQKQVFNDSSIQVLILGGAGKPGVQTLSGDNVSQLKTYLLAGANYSKTSPAVIISYSVNYLVDNSIARVSSSTDYTVRTATNVPGAIPLTAIRVTWTTTGDDKNWNTQPVVEVFDGAGRKVGHIDCCSGDRNSDKWDSGRVETRNLQVLGSATNLDVGVKGRFTAIRNPVGNDDWDYSASIELDFADGTRLTHTCSGRNSCSSTW